MSSPLPQIVIVGAGFAGLRAARQFAGAPVQVTLVDQNNYHLFQPLLYQVATAGVSATDIAYPVRAIFRKQANFTFRMATVTDVDFAARQVLTDRGPIPYDQLILGVGGETNTFGLQGVARHAFPLKSLDDAIRLRNHILRMFELSAQAADPETRAALRTFVVVGGGPTGVECAGALSELIRLVLVKDFPGFDLSDVQVHLVERMDSLLPGFPPALSAAAAETLRRKHVNLNFGWQVQDYDGEVITLQDGRQLPAHTLVWAAGVQAVSLLKQIGLPTSRQGRVPVLPTLQVPGLEHVWVVGDAAYLEEAGQPLPMMAPVAIQQGELAANNILRQLSGQPLQEFQYKDPGSLATIGRNAAVARINRLKFSGFAAWLVWLAVHIFWLIGFRNRLLVMINWAWDYLFYERAVRLITSQGTIESQRDTAPPDS